MESLVIGVKYKFGKIELRTWSASNFVTRNSLILPLPLCKVN